MTLDYDSAKWPRRILRLAGAFHVVGALVIVAQPSLPFAWLDLPTPSPPEVWQAFSLVMGLLGVAFCMASFAPSKHWLLVLFGLMVKVALPVGYLVVAIQGKMPWSLGPGILISDIAWWLPLASVLFYAARAETCTSNLTQATWDETLAAHVSQRGRSLMELSRQRRTLAVFIRHAGCTFCREMLADLSAQRARLESHDVDLAVIHMGAPLEAAQLAIQYDLEGVHMISDPTCELYEAFGLERGTISQLFGPKVWLRGFWAGVVEGHGIGVLKGDGFRLQGAFVLEDGEVVAASRARTAADPIDFVSLCKATPRKLSNGSGVQATARV